jgi:hypothetical protein
MPWDVAPACTTITQPYGCVDYAGEWACPGCGTGRYHAGIDLGGRGIFRSEVRATRSGVVSAVGIPYLGDQAVAVRTDEGVTIEHGHLDEAKVSVGQRVKVGDLLGLLGTKGMSTGPHLHLEVRVDGPFQGVAGCPQNDPTRNPVPYLRASYMIAGLDSSGFRPTPASARAARDAGVRLWSGYLATKPSREVGLTGWDRPPFEAARLCGGTPLAYCSGWDDPVACKELAAAWNVRLCLDVEDGIRGNGDWVQGWLDASGAGLYGNRGVHAGRRAPFHVVAGYPGGDPRTVWPNDTERPDEPVGWQWQGTHGEFGGDVDRGWFESWFLGVAAPTPPPPIALGEGMLIFHPTDTARLDQVAIGTDGSFYHRNASYDTHFLAGTPWDRLHPGPFLALSASAAWKASGDYLAFEATAEDGKIWQALVKADGSPYTPWEAGLGSARIPGAGAPGAAGPAGPPGASYDDTELRSQLKRQADLIAAVAKALNQ